jgi:hypothetical protein
MIARADIKCLIAFLFLFAFELASAGTYNIGTTATNTTGNYTLTWSGYQPSTLKEFKNGTHVATRSISGLTSVSYSGRRYALLSLHHALCAPGVSVRHRSRLRQLF